MTFFTVNVIKINISDRDFFTSFKDIYNSKVASISNILDISSLSEFVIQKTTMPRVRGYILLQGLHIY